MSTFQPIIRGARTKPLGLGMRRWGESGCILLVLTAGTPLLAAAAERGPEPVMVVRETTQDGGTVEQGSVIHYHFVVANRGKADLELKQVKPGCGCSIARWQKRIKPGQEGAIDAEMQTEHFRGPVAKNLKVFSNDPERPQVELTLRAQVTPLVQIEPRPVALLSVSDKPAAQEFILQRTGGRPMKVLQVTSSVPYLKTELAPLAGEGRYRLTVTATTETPPGRSTGSVLVHTDLEKAADLTLTLTVDRGILAVPPAVFWNLEPGDVKAPLQAMVTIGRQPGSFHVTGAAVDDPRINTKLQTLQDGAVYQVTLTCAGNWDAGSVQRTLTVTTDDASQSVIKIPVQLMVQSTKVDSAGAAGPHAGAGGAG